MKHISDNKHKFNLRRVDELSNELSKLEEELKNTTGFFNKLKVKRKIKKTMNIINTHANEITIYENEKNKSA